MYAVYVWNAAGSLSCYDCVSSQPGCGKELNIRLQRHESCPGTGQFGGDNFCVKVIETIGCKSDLNFFDQ